MEHRFITCSGIGDFSWLWSKFSTTEDKYFIEYVDSGPDRLGVFLNLLPKDKIAGFAQNKNYRVNFNTAKLEMYIIPEVPRLQNYSQFSVNSGIKYYVEINTHLENGNRIEAWMPELRTDLHYKIEGVDTTCPKQNIFIVHSSSFHMQKVWNTYGVDDSIEMIDMVQKKTGWMPVFIGATYDDMAKAVFEKYIDDHSAVSLIGRTENIVGLLNWVQQSKLFLGLVSSGMTMLANVLYTPTISWWPRPKLPQAWADEKIPYKWLLWSDHKKDMVAMEDFISRL